MGLLLLDGMTMWWRRLLQVSSSHHVLVLRVLRRRLVELA
jgi:hypothetical protein